MNKIFNIFTIVFLSVMALSLGSCTEEYEYSAADKVEGQQVYFSNALGSTLNLSDTESNFALTLNRIDTSSELTVNLTLSDESGIYSIPSSVTFAQGDSAVQFNLSYDPAKLEYDVFNSVTIAIADADYTTPYGNSSYTFSAGMPSPYVSIGVGRFADNYLVSGYAEVEIMQNQNNPNEFRIMHPYDEIAEFLGSTDGGGMPTYPDQYPEYLQVYVLQPGDQYPNGTAVTGEGMVYFDEASVGVDIFGLGYPAEIWHPSLLSVGGVPGDVTHNLVTEWQDNGLPGQIQLAPFYIVPQTMQGNSQASNDDVVVITFPGFDPKDYTVEVSYLGAFSSADGDSYAMGNVTLGEDIEEAKVAVVEGNDVNAALAQVVSGAVETVTVTESGEVRVPCKYSGNCTMIAIGYAEGEMQAYDAATFEFALGPSQWTSIGTGLYTDYILCNFLTDQTTGEPAPAIEYPVTVQESNTTPGIYRLLSPYDPEVNPYGGYFDYDSSSSYNIIINASDPDAVYMQMQPTGISAGQNGEVYILSNGGYEIDLGGSFDDLKAKGMLKGSLKDGIITFDADELLFALTGTDKIYYAAEGATPILKLPSATSSQAIAKAAKTRSNTRMVVKSNPKLSKSSSLKAKKKSVAKRKIATYQLNQNVKLNRK